MILAACPIVDNTKTEQSNSEHNLNAREKSKLQGKSE